MATSGIIRRGAVAFMIGGVVWIVFNLITLSLGPEAFTYPSLSAFSLSALYILVLLLSAGGLVGFHALQKGSYGRVGRAGFYTVLVSSAILILASVVFLFGSEAIGFLNPVGLLGVLGVLVGFVLYGVATLQARVLPRWCGVLFIIFLPVAIVLGPSGGIGNIWTGLVQLALGYTLLQRGTSAQQPSRVS